MRAVEMQSATQQTTLRSQPSTRAIKKPLCNERSDLGGEQICQVWESGRLEQEARSSRSVSTTKTWLVNLQTSGACGVEKRHRSKRLYMLSWFVRHIRGRRNRWKWRMLGIQKHPRALPLAA